MKWEDLPKDIKGDIADNYIGYRKVKVGPTEEDIEYLNSLTPAELFSRYCNWHGLTNWGYQLIRVWETIKGEKQNERIGK